MMAKENYDRTPEECKAIADKWKRDELIKSGVLKPASQIDPQYYDDKTKERLKKLVGNVYQDIRQFLSNYVDMREQDYDLITLWIIGTYIHDEFETFPYLFINAMRGSGKSRLLKIIKELSKDGVLNTSMRESVLFRMGKKTLCIDEFEGVGGKDAQALREVLNASYKKGMQISRMKKVRSALGEGYEQEDFEPYKPIAMANIWGMEEVLGDRCVTIILEKSGDNRRTRLSEDFSDNPVISCIKAQLNGLLVYMCSYFGVEGIWNRWNNYINDRYNYTTTYYTYNTYTTQTTHTKLTTKAQTTENKLHNLEILEMFNKIHDTNINGRNLELMMPFILISKMISSEVFERVLQIATDTTKERKENEMTESKDVILIDYISKFTFAKEFITIKKITTDFRAYVGDDEGDEKWINARWVGRALKRLSLIKEKRRVSQGIEVIPDVLKAEEKIKIFKEKEVVK